VPTRSWSKACARVASASPYGSTPGWGLAGAIVKSGDDCRQELLALQLIRELQDIWTGLCWWGERGRGLLAGRGVSITELLMRLARGGVCPYS
jgi:phosphatidylinositol 4-kinase